MTISLSWNKCPSIAIPRYSMPSSGVFLCLDSGVLFGTGRAVVECDSLWPFKIQPSNGVHNAGTFYYTITRYIPFKVYFLMVSKPDRITSNRRFYQLFEIFHSDRIVARFWYTSYWWRIDKEEGIRWRSYHLDQLQSWKSSQVRLVKISVGVIMLTERFCPVLMLRPFKKHSANTTTQKNK